MNPTRRLSTILAIAAVAIAGAGIALASVGSSTPDASATPVVDAGAPATDPSRDPVADPHPLAARWPLGPVGRPAGRAAGQVPAGQRADRDDRHRRVVRRRRFGLGGVTSHDPTPRPRPPRATHDDDGYDDDGYEDDDHDDEDDETARTTRTRTTTTTRTTRTRATMTDRISPLALSAPIAALVVVAATGWATTNGDAAATPTPPPAVSTAALPAGKDPALKALTKAIDAERSEIRHLERAVEQARKRLEAARERSQVVIVAAPSTSSGSTSSTTTSSSGSSSGGGSAPQPAPAPAPKPAPAPPANGHHHRRLLMPVSAPADTWTRHTFAAMGTVVAVSVPAADDTAVLIGQVEALFGRVERSCTRFDAGQRPDARQRRPDGCARGGT